MKVLMIAAQKQKIIGTDNTTATVKKIYGSFLKASVNNRFEDLEQPSELRIIVTPNCLWVPTTHFVKIWKMKGWVENDPKDLELKNSGLVTQWPKHEANAPYHQWISLQTGDWPKIKFKTNHKWFYTDLTIQNKFWL